MTSLYLFLYSSHANTNKRNKVKARVENFIQITVFCHPSLNKVDTFVYWNAAKACSYTLLFDNIFTCNLLHSTTLSHLRLSTCEEKKQYNTVIGMMLKWKLRCKVCYTLKLKITGYNDIFLKINPYHGIKKKRPALNIEDNEQLL